MGDPRAAIRAAGRIALWVGVVIVLVRGLEAIASGPAEAPSTGPPENSVVGFPNQEARAFAVRFVGAYLDHPSGDEAGRFFAAGLSERAAGVSPPSLGADVAWATVAREVQLGGSRALVTVAAVTHDGGSRYVSVPVARDRRGGLVVYALPSFAPPPPRASLHAGDNLKPLSGSAAEAIGNLAGRFVRAYVAGADRASLAYLLLPAAQVAAMPPGLRVASIERVDDAVSTTGGRRRSVVVSVSVRDTDSGGVYPLAYRLDLERRDRWYVAAVAGGPSS